MTSSNEEITRLSANPETDRRRRVSRDMGCGMVVYGLIFAFATLVAVIMYTPDMSPVSVGVQTSGIVCITMWIVGTIFIANSHCSPSIY
jgi:hypothetical protein